MDALLVEEKNAFAHCSRHAGKMHACGHDGHIDAAARRGALPRGNKDALDFDGNCPLHLPAGRGVGSRRRRDGQDGLFDLFPVEAVHGLHNWPGIAVGEMSVMPGPVMAGTCAFEISICGHAVATRRCRTRASIRWSLPATRAGAADGRRAQPAPVRIGGGQRDADPRRRSAQRYPRRCRPARHDPHLRRKSRIRSKRRSSACAPVSPRPCDDQGELRPALSADGE